LRRLLVAVAVLFAVLSARPARAVIGTIDNVPSATLLYPYFEIDLGNAQGVNTLIAIQNASASAGLMNVTLWTDLGIPTVSFNIYFTGFDTQTISLRDIFVNGVVPRTASVGQDPNDTISPHGPISQDINFASCNLDPDDFGFGDDGPLGPFLPPINPLLTAAQITDLQRAHTGQSSVSGSFGIAAGQCSGSVHTDSIARGYVTVDDTVACTALNPHSASGYFPANSAVVGTRNIWFGDIFYVRPGANLMEADVAVPIEASAQNPLTSTSATPKYTFYARMPGVNLLASDNREPLATSWAASDLNYSTDLLVWRDPIVDVAPFACGAPPATFPLPQTQAVAFDTEENPLPLSGALFPVATQRTPVGPAPMTIPGEKAGWLFLNLNNPSLVSTFGGVRQSWVEVLRTPEAPPIMSTGWSGVQLGNAATGANPTVGPPP
jgi:hypothetical protein